MPNNTEPESITDFPFPKPEPLYDETVKDCENCDRYMVRTICLTCDGLNKWAPIPTTGKQWKKVKAIEKAHRDAADSKLNFGDKE